MGVEEYCRILPAFRGLYMLRYRYGGTHRREGLARSLLWLMMCRTCSWVCYTWHSLDLAFRLKSAEANVAGASVCRQHHMVKEVSSWLYLLLHQHYHGRFCHCY